MNFCGNAARRLIARQIKLLLRSLVLLGAAAFGVAQSAAVASPVDFAKDVRPILEAACFKCHGAEKQKSGLRLDLKNQGIKGGESGAAIVPGKSAESLLLQLVEGKDPDRIMPEKGERLTAEQIATLRAWIDDGAIWPDDATEVAAKEEWWSLKPVHHTKIPDVRHTGWTMRNEIDAFVFAALAEKGFEPAPEADRRTLARRIYFDLVGLPPAAQEVENFVNDSAPDAYERLVDRLLATAQYGERWARRWMDVAHFAETHGHDQDRIREHAWRYRDYLIDSFNRDKPYAQFLEEQIAADILYPNDPQLVVALGFLAAGPWDESSLRDIREDTLDRQIGRYLDRDDMVATVMNTFVSTTVQCARCHDHKFDPVSQRDYYALQAVFAGVDKGDRTFDFDPTVHRKRQDLRAHLAAVEKGDRALLLDADVQRETASWEAVVRRSLDSWQELDPVEFVSSGGTLLTRQSDRALLASGPRPECDTYTITAEAPLPCISGVRLELLTDDSLPQRGPGRMDNGNLHLSEFQLLVSEPNAASPKTIALRNPQADFNQEQWTIAHAIDGDEKTAWGIHPKVGEPHEAAFQLAEKLTVVPGTKLTFVLKQLHGRGHLIGRLRLSVAATESGSPMMVIPHGIRELLDVPAAERSADQRAQLAQFQERGRLTAEIAALPEPLFAYAATNEATRGKPRPVHRLHRGDIQEPREEAGPGALSCIAQLPARFKLADNETEGARRAALAKWISDSQNPLTWRSVVNRVWQYHFGRGIVDTPNDFGRMGGTPSHAELLDWLALRFRDTGGSIKALDRLIVTSATYRQSTRFVPGYAALDADNRSLWRMNRTRLDAESVRDAVLAVAGQLVGQMGGPSARQFDLQPGIHVTPRIDYSKFDLDSDAARRRSVYRFLFRTLPDPLMDALDCPAGDQLTPTRNASVTVQQALALWNSAFIARESEHFAARIESLGENEHDRIAAAVELAYSRAATPREIAQFSEYTKKHGLANLCRLLLNANEFLFIN